MTKPEAKDDIASGEENHGYCSGKVKYTLHITDGSKTADNYLI
jgi:hypothetical protein